MRVLIGCECSGVVRRAFRALGHDAWSCDLKPAEDSSEFHILGDVVSVMGNGWDFGLFHPDCTYLNSAGLHWIARGRIESDGRPRTVHRNEALEFVRRLFACEIPMLAIENPVGCIGTQIRPADQYIQPYQFGDDASKNTGLWLKGLPQLAPTKYIYPRMVCKCGGIYEYARPEKEGCPHCGAERAESKPRWSNQTDSGQNKLAPSDHRATDRARTYPGIARAMAEQWGTI